ncbi:MAG: DUF4139 domain-containing protein [Synergistaceae bacterium]|nr:DUF4139 domain-containing protein [Synergistaceae bacterium]
MRAPYFLAMSFAAVLLCAKLSFAAEVPEDYTNSITAIDFYPSGAKFSFRVEPYDNEKNFKAVLPGSFNADSIRLINPEDIEGDIRIEEFKRERWIPSQLAALKSELDELEKEISRLNAKKSALEQTLEMLKDFEPEKSNPEALLNYIKDSQVLRLATENELAALKAEITKKQAKQKTLSAELNARRPSGDTSYILITGKTMNYADFSAFTPAASWYPKYILDLDSSSGKIEADLFVRASQKTGLDYKGDVTLHTKTPDERITKPVINPLRVGIKPKEETIATVGAAKFSRNNKMYESARMAMPMMEEDTAAMEFDEEVNAPAPAVKETLADRAVEATGTLTGDGTERALEVYMTDIKLKGDVLILLIPEQRENAWIIASMDKDNDKLIPGEADLRVDGATAGKITLGEYGESQKEIPFGYADAITVKKEALVEKKGVSWFSGVFNSGYKLEITNGTSDERVITVKDRLPIPTDEKIKLDIKRIEPKEKERDRENRLTWEITVPAGATVPIIVDYTLSYPSGEELQYR